MWNPTEAITGAEHAAELLGDVQELAGQLDPAPSLDLAPTLQGARVDSILALRERLARFTAETLSQREWPVIVQAWQFTREGKARELIALDQEWTQTARSEALAEASFRVGRRQLNKLRGLRHERVIARYLEAIESGRAQGWHPVVYGVVLGVYHLPLRPGLIQFASQSLVGLTNAAERIGRLPARECQEILDLAVAILPAHLPPLPSPGEWASV